jgi:competence protein ComEA
MSSIRYLSVAALLAFTASGAFAQAPATTPSAKPTVPAASAPAGTPAPSTMMKTDSAKGATSATSAKLDLNTASADDLGKLPQIGPAHAKAIVEARAKGKFKDWSDFAGRHVVPSNAETAIKDLVVVR